MKWTIFGVTKGKVLISSHSNVMVEVVDDCYPELEEEGMQERPQVEPDKHALGYVTAESGLVYNLFGNGTAEIDSGDVSNGTGTLVVPGVVVHDDMEYVVNGTQEDDLPF